MFAEIPMNAPKIFLSYASEDKDVVTRVHAELVKFGFQPWLDKIDLQPGENWRASISKAIRTSDYVMVFLSKASVSKRGFVQKEFRIALDVLRECPEADIFLIPVKIDDCDVPRKFSHLHCVHLHESGSLEGIVNAIRQHRSRTAAKSAPAALLADFVTMVSRGSHPSYDLDLRWNLVGWNPSFFGVIAKPMGLIHGCHVIDFIRRCENYRDVLCHSRAVFGSDERPWHDKEIVVIQTERFGRTVFNKTAYDIRNRGWHVELLPVDGVMMADLVRALVEIGDA
jgi:hypothetical protein